ncbi:hypothetical protein MP228_009692 [Amoeboaphelidium protococcarum]|nr:hypothetical protein MP228_009692 [Amoeboaphelidium protococcarum]
MDRETALRFLHHQSHVDGSSNEGDRLVQDFILLNENAQNLFNRLKSLPLHGPSSQWHQSFQETFQVFSNLWKFQQDHRQLLTKEGGYNLRRWEIGDIASKIGQLYYHYYLRTSEYYYLKEAYVFYEAIRDRQYFRYSNSAQSIASVTLSEDSRDNQDQLQQQQGSTLSIIVKKMRYYARYIVVCLLLNTTDLLQKLTSEFRQIIQDYSQHDQSKSDIAEWEMILKEVEDFSLASTIVLPKVLRLSIMDPPRIQYDARMSPDRIVYGHSFIEECIIVGYKGNDVKFSELSIDMHRILVSMECASTQATEDPGQDNDEQSQMRDLRQQQQQESMANNQMNRSGRRRMNPKNTLLYKPSAALWLYCASSSLRDCRNGAMMFYFSCDVSVDLGNVLVLNNSNGGDDSRGDQMLMAQDLQPYRRRPLLLVVDGCNATAFTQQLESDQSNQFKSPLVILSSSLKSSSYSDGQSLMTMFLSCPVAAFCILYNIQQCSSKLWDLMTTQLDRLCNNVSELLVGLNYNVNYFMNDVYGCRVLSRFVLLCIILEDRNRRASSDKIEQMPTIFPRLQDDIYRNDYILSRLQTLLTTVQELLQQQKAQAQPLSSVEFDSTGSVVGSSVLNQSGNGNALHNAFDSTEYQSGSSGGIYAQKVVQLVAHRRVDSSNSTFSNSNKN